MTGNSYLLIVNPTAGRGRAANLLPSLRALLEAQHISFEIRFTSGSGEATRIAKEAVKNGFRKIVSVGGDGTAHEIANGLANTRASLGFIPAGSGNDFPKALGIPLQLSPAVEVLVHGCRRPVDLGLLEGRYFINGLGIGLDGAVSHRFRSMKTVKGYLGYVFAAFLEALTFAGFDVEIELPEWSYKGIALLVGASNGPFQGGMFKLAPEAKVDDGLLDVHVVRDMPPLKRLVKIPQVLRGTHTALREVEIRRASTLAIVSEKTLPAHMDGESFSLEPGSHKVSVVSNGLEVISAGDG